MPDRLKRPGYWIVLLAIITVLAYRQFQINEAKAREEALMKLYRSYGESVLSDLRAHRLLALQNRFGEEGEQRIDLEDIALFIDTLHLDRARHTRWQNLKSSGNNMQLSGELQLDGNLSYPIDMIVIKRGERILLRGVKVGGKELKLDREGFPLESVTPTNESNGSS